MGNTHLSTKASDMTVDEIAGAVRRALGPSAQEESGNVLSVAPDAIKPGRFYVMGLNPGGDPGGHPGSIRESIVARPPGWTTFTHDCCYCDDRPTCRHTDDSGKVLEAFLTRHQRNVLVTLKALGVEPGSIVATNAIFARSTGEETLAGPWDWWAKCWPIHQLFLREVKPDWIITLGSGLGTSAFAFLVDETKRAGGKRPDIHAIGSGKTGGRWFSAQLPDGEGGALDVRVLGLPHPSYYAPGAELLKFIDLEVAWAPIETAPRDGRPLRLRSATGQEFLGSWFSTGGAHGEWGRRYSDDHGAVGGPGDVLEPTSWRHL